jgi:hypothetical protein
MFGSNTDRKIIRFRLPLSKQVETTHIKKGGNVLILTQNMKNLNQYYFSTSKWFREELLS